MLADVFNMEGKKVNQVELPEMIFGAPVNIDLMHQAYVRQMANAHLGTHDTKVRNEVAGGGRKPWKQKGTGRARQGSIRAAQWKGGGRIFTPHPRSYNQDMPRKMRRAALRSALSVKAAEASIVVVDELKIAEPRTRLMASALNLLVGESSALVLIPEKTNYDNVILSSSNLPATKVMLAGYLNIRDLLTFDKVVLPLAALEIIQSNLG
ncbi:MAG TPA: 50S ribosomal protein L4 [Bellilinea sp.]|uniref:Large ribosomal subunit protein uL4 n=2 Tax=environmental samples TaxID=58229 RepID=A0A0H4TCL4_9CHLR|nr:50S ribosomal protein L4, large subunit ribosomal protein L4 [uncultured Chloroflexi bacterium Rifle_16ft_4_minimus_640]AKQ05192.1 50S ribosomal protein L4, large subunit ribosomal protein L4 [uncultured Chloroflexi bacterium Rifle_16ft_4_minimus_24332]